MRKHRSATDSLRTTNSMHRQRNSQTLSWVSGSISARRCSQFFLGCENVPFVGHLPCTVGPRPFHGNSLMKSADRLEAFSAVVDSIYDASIDTSHWHEALLDIRQLVGASSASLLQSRNASADNTIPSFLFLSGYSESFIQALSLKYWTMWAVQTNIAAWKVGELRHLPDIMPREEYLNGRFYREVLQPHRQLDFMGMIALREEQHIVHLNISTTNDDGPFLPRNVEMMRLLAPHVCRSVKISLALDLKTLQANQFETTLDSLGAGVFLTQRDGRIVFMNRAAEQQVKRGVGVKIDGGRLVPKDRAAAAVFAQNFANPREVKDNPGTRTISIAMPDEAGGLIATILPLGSGRRQSLMDSVQRAVFAVFLQDPAAAQAIPGEAIARLYDLTPAELRVVLAITPSHGARGAADILGVSLATVKSHLQRIYQKTGVGRHGDLVQLLLQASAPTVANPGPPQLS